MSMGFYLREVPCSPGQPVILHKNEHVAFVSSDKCFIEGYVSPSRTVSIWRKIADLFSR